MVIRLVVIKHPFYPICWQAHIYSKISRYIPRTVFLRISVITDLRLQMFYIRHSSKYNRPEGLIVRILLLFQVSGSKFSKEIKKYLIISSRINLVDHQYNRLSVSFAPFIKNPKYIIQLCVIILVCQALKHIIILIRYRYIHIVSSIT